MDDDYFTPRPEGGGDGEPTDDGPDHYAALRVDRRATAEEISAAYGRRVAELRVRQQEAREPDALMAAQFELEAVEEAWRILSDPGDRTSYDLDATFGARGDPGASTDAYTPPTAKTRFALAAAVAALALVGVVVAALSGGGDGAATGRVPVTDLRIGDCFDSGVDDSGGDTVSVQGVDVVDCAAPHNNEVFALRQLPDGPDTLFPGDEEAFVRSGELCLQDFAGYVGVVYEDSVLDVSVVYPSAETWAEGDREIVCAVYDPSGAVSGTLRGAGR